jgi:hypothetical protein
MVEVTVVKQYLSNPQSMIKVRSEMNCNGDLLRRELVFIAEENMLMKIVLARKSSGGRSHRRTHHHH